MKRAICSTGMVLMLMMILGGCTYSGSTTTPIPAAISPSPTVTLPASPIINPGTPDSTQLSQDIPDVVIDPSEYMDYSDTKLYEDAEYLYALGYADERYPLYAISKKTGEAAKIADNAFNFTCSEGYVYWIEFKTIDAEGNGEFKTLYRYDVQTGESLLIRKFSKRLYGLIVNDDRMYLVYERYTEKESEQNGIDWFSDLYSMSLTGKNMRRLKTDAYVAASYKTKFYSTKNSEEGESVYEYDPATGRTRDITKEQASNFYFAAGYGKLFYESFEKGLTMVDLVTLEEKKIADETGNAYAVLGQYLFYITLNEPDILMAYDIQSGEIYRAVKIDPATRSNLLKATRYNLYMQTGEEDGINGLFRIVIEGGKGKLVKVTR